MRTVSLCLGAAAALAVSTGAFADAAADAQHHFESIAAGYVDDVMAAYAGNARFEWVGGPLNGSYVGTKPIREVWTKFTQANGPLEIKVTNLQESANPAGATVTANVEFKGKHPIKVRYVLLYRGGKLIDEVWQIDPKLEFARY